MALLLSSKFVRCFATNVKGRCLFKGQIYAYRRKSVFEIRDLVRSFSSTQQDTKLDRSLRRLDQDVRRVGRISKRELEEALEELKTSRSTSGTHSLLLIRCCGSLLLEEPLETRTQLVEDVWKMLHKLGVPLDISHYNALLRVYLENEHHFSPTEFLGNLERKGIEPNRVTYQRLVERYCQGGDIEGATHILEFMRAKQLPVNEYIFNSLILGHSQSGDMKSAADILNVMKHAGLEPSVETYTTLLCGYAQYGDIQCIRTTLEQCKKDDVHLLNQDYMEILYAMAINGHEEHVDEITGKFHPTIGFNQDAYNLVLKLTNKRKFEIAKKVLFTMSQGAREGQLLPSGGFFIRQLVKANCPVQEILTICEDMQREGLNDRCVLMATEYSLLQGNTENANVLLTTLKSQGYTIRQHYFWPLIVSCGKAGNSEGILEILRAIRERFELDVEEETLREYAVPWLCKLDSNSYKNLISKLQTVGTPFEVAVMSLVHHLLSQNNIADALQVARKHRVNYFPVVLRKPLLQAYRLTGDATSFAGMLHAMCVATENMGITNVNSHVINEGLPIPDQFEMVGQMLLDAVSIARNNSSSDVEKLLEAMFFEGLAISNSTAEKLVEKLGNQNLTTEISNLLEKLTSGVTISQVHRAPPQGISIGAEFHLINLMKSVNAKGELTHNVKKQLLNMYCKNQNLEKAFAMWKELVKDEVSIGRGLVAQLIDVCVSNDNLEKALRVLKWFQGQSNDFILDRPKVVKLATLFVKNNDVEGALTLLDNQAQTQKTEENTYLLNAVCRSLLFYLADQGVVETLKKMFDNLMRNGYIELNSLMLGALIKVHIVRNDLDSAMKQFEELCHMYRCTPMKNELTRKFIEGEDALSLQKITDLSTNIHGEVNSLYDLVFAFVECGRIRQARKILETPGLVSRPQRVDRACKRYSQEGMVSTLEGLMEATKLLPHIDPSNIYQHLLLTYRKKDDAANAMGLWVKMQEENLQPTDEFLIVLGKFLKEKKLSVPFAIPEVLSPSDTDANENTSLYNFKSALEKNKFVEALEILESMDNNIKQQISRTQLSSLLEKLSKSGRQQEASTLLLCILQMNKQPSKQIFQTVINELANAGNILTLKVINEHLDESSKKIISYNNNLCRAYVFAGQASEYLQALEEEIDGMNCSDVQTLTGKLPGTAMLLLLKTHPELYQQYQKICEKYFMHGITAPFNMLWIHHALNHQYSVADDIWNQYICKSQGIRYDIISRHAYQQLDLSLATYVVERLKDSLIEAADRGYAYSCVVDILLSNGKLKEVVKFVNESKSVISYDNLSEATRGRLESISKEQKNFSGSTTRQQEEERK